MKRIYIGIYIVAIGLQQYLSVIFHINKIFANFQSFCPKIIACKLIVFTASLIISKSGHILLPYDIAHIGIIIRMHGTLLQGSSAISCNVIFRVMAV